MFYDVYAKLCEERGVKPYALVLELGAPNNSIVANWRTLGTKPRAELMQKIADYFGVSTTYLLEQSRKDPKEIEPYNKADALTVENKKSYDTEKSPAAEPQGVVDKEFMGNLLDRITLAELDRELIEIWESSSPEDRQLLLDMARAIRNRRESK